MKFFVIFATVVAYTYAAPTVELLHPSPVNPDVLVAIKPEEKIILMTDPKEIAKFKREAKLPLYPTVLPKAQAHHITKRDHGTLLQQTPCLTDKHTEIKSHDEKNDERNENLKNVGLQEHQTPALLLKEYSPVTEQLKRNTPVQLVPNKPHPEQNTKIKPDTKVNEENINDQKAKYSLDQQQHKRDIPVPLIPKYHHPEESPKDLNEQDLKNQKITSTVAHEQEQISQDVQQKTEALKETNEFSLQQKRETPVSLIPLQESSGDKNLQYENKDVKVENADTTQGLNTNKHDNVQTNPDQKLSIRIHDRHLQEKKAEHNKHKPVVHNVQIEDASLFNSTHKPITHIVSTQYDHKPNIQDDRLSASQYTQSSTEHHLVRPHPVPVAELFARDHGN